MTAVAPEGRTLPVFHSMVYRVPEGDASSAMLAAKLNVLPPSRE
jgi:hypothetical protein